jgi:hypothetical protein
VWNARVKMTAVKTQVLAQSAFAGVGASDKMTQKL